MLLIETPPELIGDVDVGSVWYEGTNPYNFQYMYFIDPPPLPSNLPWGFVSQDMNRCSAGTLELPPLLLPPDML